MLAAAHECAPRPSRAAADGRRGGAWPGARRVSAGEALCGRLGRGCGCASPSLCTAYPGSSAARISAPFLRGVISVPCCPPLPGVALARGLEAAGPTSRLCSLDLKRICAGAAEAIGRALAAQGPAGALRRLVLSWNRICPDGAARLAEGLRLNSSLVELDLSNSRLGPEGAAAIAAALSGSAGVVSGVRHLNLASNKIGSKGVPAMLEAGLGRSASLTRLDVRDNGIQSQKSLVAIALWAAGRVGGAAPLPPPADHPPPTAAVGGSCPGRSGSGAGGCAPAPPGPYHHLRTLIRQQRLNPPNLRASRRLTVVASDSGHKGSVIPDTVLEVARIVAAANAAAAAAPAASPSRPLSSASSTGAAEATAAGGSDGGRRGRPRPPPQPVLRMIITHKGRDIALG